MKKILYITSFLFILINFGCNTQEKLCNCCDKSFTDINSAITCFEKTKSENETSSDSRLLLIAFVDKDIKANQKLGWQIIKDPEIIEEAKKNYALVIIDSKEYKTLNHQCHSLNFEHQNKDKGKPYFVIANQALCIFGIWTLSDDKELIIDRLGIGDGP